jgi:hypothetical protein
MEHNTTFLLCLMLSSGFGRAGFALLYGDPGSGSLVWQLLLAAFFGVVFYVRFYARKFKDTMSLRGGDKQGNEPDALPRPGDDEEASVKTHDGVSAGKK